MIVIDFPKQEWFNEETQTFVITNPGSYAFEHSLYSISLWESKYKKPFLIDNEKSIPEMMDYFSMMCLDKEFKSSYLTTDVINTLSIYLKDSQSATTIKSNGSNTDRRVLTSEVIYAYMANAQIPFSCEKWNLNRLLNLLGVISELNQPGKPMSRRDILEENRRLNEERRKKYNTRG